MDMAIPTNPRLRDVEALAEGRGMTKWQTWGENPGLQVPFFWCLPPYHDLHSFIKAESAHCPWEGLALGRTPGRLGLLLAAAP